MLEEYKERYGSVRPRFYLRSILKSFFGDVARLCLYPYRQVQKVIASYHDYRLRKAVEHDNALQKRVLFELRILNLMGYVRTDHIAEYEHFRKVDSSGIQNICKALENGFGIATVVTALDKGLLK